MEIEKAYQALCKRIEPSQVLRNESMKKHTSFQIGGEADILVQAKSQEDMKHAIEVARKEKIPFYVLGNGSNVLVKDQGIRGIVIVNRMTAYAIEKKEQGVIVTAQSGVKLGALAQKLLKEEIAGFEFASGIPGTIGGAIRMNAGAHGSEMQDIVLATTYMDLEGTIHTMTNQEQAFSYRTSIFCNQPFIILQTTLTLGYGNKEEIQAKMTEYATYRKEKQPIQYPSAGSTFKRGNNFITAQVIDECGLKGYRVGGAMVSDLHAGFIVNTANATAQDVITLIEMVKKTVKEKCNKEIRLEIEVIGE